MKFPQLALGQRFVFRGAQYVKTSPVLARNEANGQSQMIPRSALVEPLDTPALTDTPTNTPGQDALNALHRDALACLEDLAKACTAPPQALNRVRKQLTDAYRQAVKRLSQPG